MPTFTSIQHDAFTLDLTIDQWERLFHHVLSVNEYGHLECGTATYIDGDAVIITYTRDEENNLHSLISFMLNYEKR